MLFRLCLPLLCVVLACGAKPPAAHGPTPTAAANAATRRQLTIPPNVKSLTMMRTLQVLGDAGDEEAAWQRTHYLLDLFDAARFAQDEESRTLLAEIAGRPISAMRGPAATQAIAELLVLEADRVLELNRQHRNAQAVRVLASYDAAGPTVRNEVGQAMQELKRVQKRGGVLASNSSLRLFAYCQQALIDAQTFGRAGHRIAISHCLYPLFDADPEPYFATRSQDRPPPPTISRIVATLRHEEAQDPGRIARALEAQRDWLETFSETFTKAQKTDHEVDALLLRLPPAQTAAPDDDYPLLRADADIGQLRALQLVDTRHTLALAVASEHPGAALLSSASKARGAGASSLALLVAIEQRLRVPPGDYWSEEAEMHSVLRVGQLLFSLDTMDGLPNATHDRPSEAKATSWNRRQAQLSLHLLVAPGYWTLASPDGRLARIAIGNKDSSPTESLRSILTSIRNAYPDEQGIILVPQGDVSVGALVLAAQAASHDEHMRPLFSQLALASKAPKVRPGARLLSRIHRRAALQVLVEPSQLSSRTPFALRCYQGLADSRNAPTAVVRLELGSDGNVTTLGKGATKLRMCAQAAFSPDMKKQGLRAVTVTFRAKTK